MNLHLAARWTPVSLTGMPSLTRAGRGGAFSRIKLSCGRARGEKFRVNERDLLNLSRKRCVVVWRRDAAAVPSRVCSSCGTRFFCLIASEAEHTQAGGFVCCWEEKDQSENWISQRSKGVMHEAGAVCTISNVDRSKHQPYH